MDKRMSSVEVISGKCEDHCDHRYLSYDRVNNSTTNVLGQSMPSSLTEIHTSNRNNLRIARAIFLDVHKPHRYYSRSETGAGI